MRERKEKEPVLTEILEMHAEKADLSWYAIYTKPRFEKKVYAELKELNFCTYLPLVKQLRQWSDRKKWVEEPLFRSYVFVKTERENQHAALEPEGATKFVRFNAKPAIVPEEQLLVIDKIIHNEFDFKVEHITFETGDEVEVVQGPLNGIKGKWMQDKGRTRIAIQIEQLGAQLSVDVPKVFVKKVKKSVNQE